MGYLDKTGLTYLWGKITTLLNGKLNSGDVSFTRSLTSGTKVGTLNIEGTNIVLYAPTNSDKYVTQSSNSTTYYRPLLLGASSSSNPSSFSTSTTSQAYINTQLYVKPSTGELFATGFLGEMDGGSP